MMAFQMPQAAPTLKQQFRAKAHLRPDPNSMTKASAGFKYRTANMSLNGTPGDNYTAKLDSKSTSQFPKSQG